MIGIDEKILERMNTLRIAPEAKPDPDPSIYDKVKGEKKAIFLDRDGVIIENGLHLLLEDDPAMIPGSPEAIRGFNEMGYSVVIVTNQGAIGMGLIDHEVLIDVMEYILKETEMDEPWKMAYYCPYLIDGIIPGYDRVHFDRKPGPGMLLRAAKKLDIDLESSIMIGDQMKDVEAGHRAGCRSILLQTGRGKDQVEKILDMKIKSDDIRYPDDIVYDLHTAYEMIKEESD